MEAYDVTSRKYFTDHTLSIPAVRLEDTGEYTCLGTNSAGTTNSSATLQVIGEQVLMYTAWENEPWDSAFPH